MWRIGELELIKRSHEYQMRTTNTKCAQRTPAREGRFKMNVAGMHNTFY
jgi:hypothetical protein